MSVRIGGNNKMSLDKVRQEVYEELGKGIGNTPLVRFAGEVPNGNTVYVKRECDNPFGSHYDRVYLALFRKYEEEGKIKPGDKVLETTSGAAGVSFAGIGRRLGYDCYVAMPGGGEKAREEAIKAQLESPEKLILTPAEQYIGGFPEFLRVYLAKNKDKFFLNHSMGRKDASGKPTNNETTLRALEDISYEAARGIDGDIHFFFPAVGNGSSVLGPGRVFRYADSCGVGAIGGLWGEPSSYGLISYGDVQEAFRRAEESRTRIIGFEHFQSAVAFDQLHPEEYEKRFGIKPGTLSRHRLPGTSFQGINFPHIWNAVHTNGLDGVLYNINVLEDVALISDQKTDREYFEKTGRRDTKSLPHWDTEATKRGDFGRSTRAGLAVALDIAKTVQDKNMLVIAYDKAERYDKEND